MTKPNTMIRASWKDGYAIPICLFSIEDELRGTVNCRQQNSQKAQTTFDGGGSLLCCSDSSSQLLGWK